MPEHLRLPTPATVGSRRSSAGGPPPTRNIGQHGTRLSQQLQQVLTTPRRVGTGVDPDLVFKIHATRRPTGNTMELRELNVLGETLDYTYFVLVDDQGQALSQALTQYTTTGDLRSLINLIDGIEAYGPPDRLGPGLQQWDLAGPPPEDLVGQDGLILVDVVIWAADDATAAAARTRIVNAVLEQAGAQVQLRAPGTRRNLLRVRVSPSGLRDLLETSVVEQVRTPPVPFLDFRDWRGLGADDLTRAEVPSAVVGVLDDAPATAHPLLDGLVLSVDTIEPTAAGTSSAGNYPWQPPGHHGSEVVGRVLYPHLHEELRDGQPLTAHGQVRVARVLEPDPALPANPPRFAQGLFPHELIERGIRLLHSHYGVRVFNLSLGYAEPYNGRHLGELSEVIDELARELDIVVVVPTGNVALGGAPQTPSGHHVAADYPTYLGTPEHRLAEPGPAALAITVGSIAHSEGVAEIGNRLGWQAVAPLQSVSPFSRTGPGIGTKGSRQNKPDLVHFGGNTVINDVDRVVPNDMGASIVSTALNTDGRLFAVVNGTSFAAPPVARVAADIEYAYPDASANLIRVLLAHSARPPAPALQTPDEQARAHRYGLGMPDTDRAITSGARRATMIYEGSVPIDDVHIHAIPVPEQFRRGSGAERTIDVTLAFDPPVRRQRREYLAARMQVELYKNITLTELQETLRRQARGEDNALDRRRSRYPLLVPGVTVVADATLQTRRSIFRNTFVDDENFFVVVTHRAATWARTADKGATQRYALAVTLEDQGLVQVDLRQLLQQSLQSRVRLQP